MEAVRAGNHPLNSGPGLGRAMEGIKACHLPILEEAETDIIVYLASTVAAQAAMYPPRPGRQTCELHRANMKQAAESSAFQGRTPTCPRRF